MALMLRPCANCAGIILGGRSSYCSSQCRQVPRKVRYIAAVKRDQGDMLADVLYAKPARQCDPFGPERERLVLRPLRERWGPAIPCQPSDAAGWDRGLWLSSIPPRDVIAAWLDWAEVRSATAAMSKALKLTPTPVTAAEAAAGFPSWLQPWAWYHDGGPPLDLSILGECKPAEGDHERS